MMFPFHMAYNLPVIQKKNKKAPKHSYPNCITQAWRLDQK